LLPPRVRARPGAHAARLEYAQADRVIEDEARLFEPSTAALGAARRTARFVLRLKTGARRRRVCASGIVSGGGGGGSHSHTMIGVGF